MSVVNTECAFKESALLLIFHGNGSKTLLETLEGGKKKKNWTPEEGPAAAGQWCGVSLGSWG